LIDIAYRRDMLLNVGNPDYLKCLKRFTLEAVQEDLAEISPSNLFCGTIADKKQR
jgi:hypothetical protein